MDHPATENRQFAPFQGIEVNGQIPFLDLLRGLTCRPREITRDHQALDVKGVAKAETQVPVKRWPLGGGVWWHCGSGRNSGLHGPNRALTYCAR